MTSNLKAGWIATTLAPKQCFYVGQDQKTGVSVHSELVAPIDVLFVKKLTKQKIGAEI